MFNCNPYIVHWYPFPLGGGILVDHWSTISSYLFVLLFQVSGHGLYLEWHHQVRYWFLIWKPFYSALKKKPLQLFVAVCCEALQLAGIWGTSCDNRSVITSHSINIQYDYLSMYEMSVCWTHTSLFVVYSILPLLRTLILVTYWMLYAYCCKARFMCAWEPIMANSG